MPLSSTKYGCLIIRFMSYRKLSFETKQQDVRLHRSESQRAVVNDITFSI